MSCWLNPFDILIRLMTFKLANDECRTQWVNNIHSYMYVLVNRRFGALSVSVPSHLWIPHWVWVLLAPLMIFDLCTSEWVSACVVILTTTVHLDWIVCMFCYLDINRVEYRPKHTHTHTQTEQQPIWLPNYAKCVGGAVNICKYQYIPLVFV